MIGHVQFALLLQNQNRHGGKFFGGGAQVKLGVRGVRPLVIPVGHAIALAQKHVAILGDEHRAAELLMCNLSHEQVIYLGGHQRILRAQSNWWGVYQLLALMIQVNDKLQNEYKEEANNYQYTHAFDVAVQAPACSRVA